MKKVFLAIVAVSTIFIACSKESFNNSASLKSSSVRILSDQQVDSIGQLHNYYLSEVLASTNLNSPDLQNEILNKFNGLSIENHVFVLDEFTGNAALLKAELYSNISENARGYIEIALASLASYGHVSEFNNEMASLESNVRADLDGMELDVVLVTIRVLQNSVYFWSPESIGGSGLGYGYWQTLNPNITPEGIKGALAADGISGGIGCLGIAVAAMTGPIGWGAFAICAGEAAISSAIAYSFAG